MIRRVDVINSESILKYVNKFFETRENVTYLRQRNVNYIAHENVSGTRVEHIWQAQTLTHGFVRVIVSPPAIYHERHKRTYEFPAYLIVRAPGIYIIDETFNAFNQLIRYLSLRVDFITKNVEDSTLHQETLWPTLLRLTAVLETMHLTSSGSTRGSPATGAPSR